MAVPLLEACARGLDVGAEAGLDYVGNQWLNWAMTGAAPGRGMGTTTGTVFAHVLNAQSQGRQARPLSAIMTEKAAVVNNASGHRLGNGCLMRVVPLALGYLGPADAGRLAVAARRQALFTHHGEDAGDAATLWALAIRHAILTGEADLRTQLKYLNAGRRELWAGRIDAAESGAASDFMHVNVLVVPGLQCAWIAVRAGSDVRTTLVAAVRGLGDTGTVAAIADALAGAKYGADSMPPEWRENLYGWLGLTASGLERLVQQTLARYRSNPSAYSREPPLPGTR
ncbi:hypothetical protein CspeluHIS016_0101400 [Cutaneotrichosporon spelunceum]|uniref:ADP-ribosylglycohydrolase n=1 Tax=Cutaneotrichosporon spelunceum TaxID=1672016 RepID=A0AAD3TN60_9TREE|nr:hypothetical protein CspeluHIS016_0101400 [Cutaneotrichosporon spelunceum]